MFSTRRLLTLLFATLLFASTSANASPLVFSFESYPGADGVIGTADDLAPAPYDLLRTQYSAMGLTFSQGTLLQGAFFNGNPDNHFISSSNPIGSFSIPVFAISIDSNSYWNATLTAYDQQGHVLASNELRSPWEGAGSFSGTLAVSSATPIFSFSVLPANPNYILNLDNLTLNTSPVPEPSQYLMLAAGLLLVAGRKLRHKA